MPNVEQGTPNEEIKKDEAKKVVAPRDGIGFPALRYSTFLVRHSYSSFTLANRYTLLAVLTQPPNPSPQPPKKTMAKKPGGKRKRKVDSIFLVCDETGDYNYTIRRKTGGEKLKLMKYSPRLRKHTMHTEKKK